jgi:hypothetical protein
VAINSSLMTLGRCLEALRWNQQQQRAARGGAPAGPLRVVPYRESKVTHLFRDALHGYGRVVLSVNVSPCARDYDETAHVLRYAALATQIGTLQHAEAPRRTLKAAAPGEARREKRKAEQAAKQKDKAKKGKGGEAAKAAQPQLPASAYGAAAAEPAAAEEDLSQAQELAGHQMADLQDHEEEDEEEEIVYELHGAAAARPGAGGPSPAATPRSASPAPAPLDPAGEESYGGGEYATPSTPCGSEGDDDAAVAKQAQQVQELIAQLQAAEERAVMVEGEVREEVAAEMAQLLKDMEESYRERLAAEVAAAAGGGAKGAGKGRRGRGGGPERPGQVRQGSADVALAADAEAAVEAHAALAAATASAAAAEAEAGALRAELELHHQQGRAQAGRIARLEEGAAAAELSLATARAEGEEQRLRAEALAEALEAERARGGALQQQLAELRRRSEDARTAAAEGFTSLLQEEKTQLEVSSRRGALRSHCAAFAKNLRVLLRSAGALTCCRVALCPPPQANQAMELEMSEQQAERLRKQNISLVQQLQAAMAALGGHTTPSGRPLLARLAAACPPGEGRGAAGTPHELALARARAAAAQEDMAAAAGVPAPVGSAGRTSGPRSGGGSQRGPSRFAGPSSQPGSQPCMDSVATAEEAAFEVAASQGAPSALMMQPGVAAQDEEAEGAGAARVPDAAAAQEADAPPAAEQADVAQDEEAAAVEGAASPESEVVEKPKKRRGRPKKKAGCGGAPATALPADADVLAEAEANAAAAQIKRVRPAAELEAAVPPTEPFSAVLPAIEEDEEDVDVGAPAAAAAAAEAGRPAELAPAEHSAPAQEEMTSAAVALEDPEPQAPLDAAPPRKRGGRSKRQAAAAVASEPAPQEEQRPSRLRQRRSVNYNAVHVMEQPHQPAREGVVVPVEELGAARKPRRAAAGQQQPASIEEGAAELASPFAVAHAPSALEEGAAAGDDEGARPQGVQAEPADEAAAAAAAAAAVAAAAAEGREARRASRAASQEVAAAEAAETAAADGAPAASAAAAPRGRKRRLLQPAKPLSAEMRCALGELAEGDLPSRQPPSSAHKYQNLAALGGVGARTASPAVRPRHRAH